jgi:predicted amidohydrolase
MQPFWGKYPGLEKRLQQLMEIVDRLQVQSQKQYGRGLDLVVLPEMAITGEGESTGEVVDWSYPLDGPVKENFAQKARQHSCYIVAPLFLLEDKATKLCSNAAVLFDRQGEVVGIYRKVHPVVDLDTGSMEHGVTAGKEEPVFACDFGKLGIQICFDINFDYGWEELARKGAEIVVWPTQSPQTTTPSSRAMRNGYYIVSSTWRNNASVFDPTGKIVSQIKWTSSMGPVENVEQPINSIASEDVGYHRLGDRSLSDNLLVQEIDLSYAVLGWSRTLENGEAFTKAFGDKAGFRYYEDDDRGIFWSNDPHMTVGQMLRSLNQTEEKEDMQRTVQRFREAGVPGQLEAGAGRESHRRRY